MKNNLKTIIFGLLSLTFLVAVVWSIGAGNAGKGNTGVSSNLESPFTSAENLTYDFGKISMAAGTVSQTFKFKNSAETAAKITKVYTSCMCTSALLKFGSEKMGPYGMAGHGFVPPVNKDVNAGEEFEVEIIFDPAAHGPAGVGPISRTVYVENSVGKPVLINFSAYVKP